MMILLTCLLLLSLLGVITLSIGYFLYDVNIRRIEHDKNKKEIHRIDGYVPADEFLETIKEI